MPAAVALCPIRVAKIPSSPQTTVNLPFGKTTGKHVRYLHRINTLESNSSDEEREWNLDQRKAERREAEQPKKLGLEKLKEMLRHILALPPKQLTVPYEKP